MTEVDDPLAGFKAATTQSIVNNLPAWANMRGDDTTLGWRTVNAWGQELDGTVNLISRQLSNMFLETSIYCEPNQLFTISVAQIDTLGGKNLTYNGSFIVPDVARSRLPLGWTDDGLGGVQLSPIGLFGCSSILMTNGRLSQIIDIDQDPLHEVTLSLYCKGSGDANILLALYLDSGTISDSIDITPGDIWQKIILPLQPRDSIRKAKIILTGSGSVYFTALQLEFGKPTDFERSIDGPRYFFTNSPLPIIRAIPDIAGADPIVVYPIGDQDEFLTTDIPTRAVLTSQDSNGLDGYGTQVYGRNIDFFGGVMNKRWVVENGEIVERALENNGDVFGRYSIRDLRVSSEGKYGTWVDELATIVPEASTTRNGILYVLCRETYLDRTLFTLKCCRAETTLEVDYLESYSDIELNLPIILDLGPTQDSESAITLGFSQFDPDILVVNTSSGRRFLYKLYYDYCLYKPELRKLYFRSNYLPGSIKVG